MGVPSFRNIPGVSSSICGGDVFGEDDSWVVAEKGDREEGPREYLVRSPYRHRHRSHCYCLQLLWGQIGWQHPTCYQNRYISTV